MKDPSQDANKTDEKPNYSIAVDGEPASTLSMPCYTISDFEKKFDISFGDKVQLNRRVRSWFRERYNEFSEKYSSSTCELTEAIVLCLWLAEQGIKEFLIFSPKVNFYAQPNIIRYVKKRRRKLPNFSVEEEEYSLVLSNLGKSDKCYACGGGYHVSSYLSADLSSHVFLCPYCAIEWAKREKLRVK